MRARLETLHAQVAQTAATLADRWAARAVEIRAHGVEEGRLHPQFWAEFCHTGHMDMLVPKEYGGSNSGLLAATMATSTLAARRIVMVPAILTSLVANAVARVGSVDLKEHYLPRIAGGEVVFAFPFTEAGAGHNIRKMATVARRTGDSIQIDGTKSYISGADLCDRMLVLARSRSDVDQFNAVIVDPATPGIELENMNLGGVEGLNQFTVRFEQVTVPARNLLGPEGLGAAALFPSLNIERILIAAVGVGSTEYLLRASVARATDRVVFGDTPIGSYQAIQHPLAELRAQLEATRLLVHEAAAMFDAGADPTDVGGYANMAKVLSADLLCRATDQAVRTFGAAAFEPERGLTEMLVDARILRNTPVSREMALNFVAERVLGLPRSSR